MSGHSLWSPSLQLYTHATSSPRLCENSRSRSDVAVSQGWSDNTKYSKTESEGQIPSPINRRRTHLDNRCVPVPTTSFISLFFQNQTMGTVLLTGANGGLGCRIVSQIVSASDAKYHGLYAVRNANAANSLDTTLVSKVKFDGASSHSHEKISLDLSRLSDIRRFAADINQRVADGSIPRIHAIILNAGYEEFEGQTWTGDDGLDTAFASNYLGHWLLVILLLQSMDCEVGRVLWISSWSHK